MLNNIFLESSVTIETVKCQKKYNISEPPVSIVDLTVENIHFTVSAPHSLRANPLARRPGQVKLDSDK